MTAPPLPRSGVASVATLGPPRQRLCPPSAPMASVQGSLALDLLPVVPRAGDPVAAAELDRLAHRFAQVVVEVLGGDRGVQQLLRWTSEAVYADLVRRTSALQRLTPGDQRLRRLRAQVRSVRLFCPTPESAEVSIHVRHGQRSRAIAARLEVIDQTWRCTALQFG